jgi:hypothetical protein
LVAPPPPPPCKPQSQAARLSRQRRAAQLWQKRLSTNTATAVPPVQEVEQYYIENYYIMPLFHKQYWMGYRAKTWGENNFAVLDSTVPLDPDQNSTQRYYHWGNMTTVMPNKTVIVRRICSLLAASCLNNQTAMDEVRCWGRNQNYQPYQQHLFARSCAAGSEMLGAGCWVLGADGAWPDLMNTHARPGQPLQGVMEPNGKKAAELCLAANYTQRFGSSGANGDAWGYMDSSCTNKFIFMCRIMRGWRGRCLVLERWAGLVAVVCWCHICLGA